jgi:hypothetical protein
MEVGSPQIRAYRGDVDEERSLVAAPKTEAHGYSSNLEADIAWVETIKPGVIYYCNNHNGESLIRIRSFNYVSVKLEYIANKAGTPFASLQSSYKVTYVLQARGLEDIKEIPLKDLPLYVGWKWLTPEFMKLLKGANK